MSHLIHISHDHLQGTSDNTWLSKNGKVAWDFSKSCVSRGPGVHLMLLETVTLRPLRIYNLERVSKLEIEMIQARRQGRLKFFEALCRLVMI